jgi:hypothetical protein
LNIAFLGATFEAPSTKDFVYGCWGPGVELGGWHLCLNFITFLVLLTFAIMFLLFYLAFRGRRSFPASSDDDGARGGVRPRADRDPGSRPDADRFLPLLASFFFFS